MKTADPMGTNSETGYAYPSVGGAGNGNFTTATFGEPLPFGYGTFKAPAKVAFLRAAGQGVGWTYNGSLQRWECVTDPINGSCAAGSSTTTIKVGSIGGPGSVTYSMKGMSIFFATGQNAGQRRTINAVSKTTSAFGVSAAFPYAPAAGDTFYVGFPISAPVGDAVLVFCEAPASQILRYWRDSFPPASVLYLLSADETTREEVIAATAGTWPSAGSAYGMQATGNALAAGMTLSGAVQLRARAMLLTDGKVPDISSEVRVGASTDMNAADVVLDLLTVKMASPMLAAEIVTDVGIDGTAASSYRTYCQAMGFNVSRLCSSRSEVSSYLADLLFQTNATAIWSEGRLKVIPMGGTAVTANGASYVPPSSATAVGPDDIIAEGDDPVSVVRRPDNEVFNTFSVSYLSRASDYSAVAVEYVDSAHANIYGVRRADSIDGSWITSEAHAQALAAILAQRSIGIRNTYRLKLPARFGLLEPMDLLSLTDSGLGIASLTVRISTISEAEDGTLDIEAYEWPAAIGAPVVMATQAYDGYGTSVDQSPLSGTMTAQTAQATADAAAAVVEAVDDPNVLTPGQKPPVVAEVATITAEYSGIYNDGLSVRNSAQRATYAAAYAALVTTNLPTLTTPVLWSDYSGNTAIVADTFHGWFNDYYAARTALLTANAALAAADAAAAGTAANGKNKTWTQASSPSSGMATGDIWFSSDTTTNCPDSNCKGHTLNASNAPNVGSYPHRLAYWPHRYSGSAWLDETVATQITAAEVVAGAITAAKIAADALSSSDYAEDANGTPTRGARLRNVYSATPTAWSAGASVGAGALYSQGGRVYKARSAGTTNAGNSPAAWAIGTTYSSGQRVMFNGVNVFRSLQNSNVGHIPHDAMTGKNGTDAWWALEGANAGPGAYSGPQIVDGSVVWDQVVPMSLSPDGLQIGSASWNEAAVNANVIYSGSFSYDSTTEWCGPSVGATTLIIRRVAANNTFYVEYPLPLDRQGAVASIFFSERYNSGGQSPKGYGVARSMGTDPALTAVTGWAYQYFQFINSAGAAQTLTSGYRFSLMLALF